MVHEQCTNDQIVSFVAECTLHLDALASRWYPAAPRMQPRLTQPEARFDRPADISTIVVVLIALVSIGVGACVTYFACN